MGLKIAFIKPRSHESIDKSAYNVSNSCLHLSTLVLSDVLIFLKLIDVNILIFTSLYLNICILIVSVCLITKILSIFSYYIDCFDFHFCELDIM